MGGSEKAQSGKLGREQITGLYKKKVFPVFLSYKSARSYIVHAKIAQKMKFFPDTFQILFAIVSSAYMLFSPLRGRGA